MRGHADRRSEFHADRHAVQQSGRESLAEIVVTAARKRRFSHVRTAQQRSGTAEAHLQLRNTGAAATQEEETEVDDLALGQESSHGDTSGGEVGEDRNWHDHGHHR